MIPSEDPSSVEIAHETGLDDIIASDESDYDRVSLLVRSGDDRGKSSTTHESDVISTEIMTGSRGMALFSMITIALCMVLCSFFLLYEFDANESKIFKSSGWNTAHIPLLMPEYNVHNFCKAQVLSEIPLGERILEFQIHVVQNLVHASLVGSAAMVAAVRGDALWMYFVRNVTFFFMPIAYIYFFLDVRSVWMGETDISAHVWRLLLTFLSALAATVGFFIYTPTFLKIRRLLNERASRGFTDTDGEGLRFPRYLAGTNVEANLASVIYVCANIVQLLAYIYYAVTLTQWLSKQSLCSSIGAMEDVTSSQMLRGLQAFEMAYSSGSHQALLISLFFLASTFPRDIASVGGALLTSSWKMLVAIGSLLHLLTNTDHYSPLSSWVNTSVEVAVMIPIVIASFVLAVRILRNPECEADNEIDEKCPTKKANSIEVYQCVSLFQIAKSGGYTSEQRKGAQKIGYGTLLLLMELTMECFIMLRQNLIGTTVTHDVYKWGMHVCVMYIFCSQMCVETPFIYHKARKLLMAACPSGSLVALWQLSTLMRHSSNIREDRFGQMVGSLLLTRAFSGFIQLAGLIQLKHLDPCQSNITVSSTKALQQSTIQARLVQLRRALVEAYVPAVAVYILVFTFLGNCSAPFVSGSLSQKECTQYHSTDFTLVQNYPGMGLFFHYGMIIVIFAANGGRKCMPSYKPSLHIASLFSIHVSLLILIHLCWDSIQTDHWSSGLSTRDLLRRLMAVVWMLASAVLWFHLERLSNARLVRF